MDNKIRSLTLSAILLLMLSACNWGGTSDPTVIGDPPLLPAVELIVQADVASPINAVGQTIQYTYTVRNTGTVPLPGVVSIDGVTAICREVNTIGNNDEFLDAGEEVTCVSSYITVQADLDQGAITTITTANVNGTLSAPVTTTVNTVPNRILTLTKSASPTTYNTLGQTITYTYVVTNSGTLDIGPTQFVVTDTGIPTPLNCDNADKILAPNATITCSISFAVSQADMDAGTINTTATVSGGGVGPSQPASATLTKENTSNLTPGTTVQHTVLEGEWLWQIARCYGADPKQVVQANSQLPNPAMIKEGTIVSVPNIGSKGKIYQTNPPIPCIAMHTVQAGETWASIAQKYNADLVVLQTVNQNNLGVGTVIKVPLNSASGTTTTPATKALTLTLSANPSTYSQLGQEITYTFVIKNSGNVTLGPAQFTVTNSHISTTPLNCGTLDTTLAPAETVSCNATYSISQTDLDATSITNIATASGGGAGPSLSASNTINKGTPSLTLNTTASQQTYNQAGQVITLTFTIMNTGDTTLGPAQFTISNSILSATPLNCGAADATIAPNTTIACALNYTITDANMNAPSILFSTTASGGGAGPSQPSNITLTKE